MPNIVHGLGNTYLSSTLRSIRSRCNSPKHKSFKHYGEKGIKCQIQSPLEILEAIGHRPTAEHTIDRIDRKGNYEIGNIRWATKRQQAENSDSAKMLTHNGKTQTITRWAESIGISRNGLSDRLKANGGDLEKALAGPAPSKFAPITHKGRTQTITEWAKELGLSMNCLKYRIKSWGIEEAMKPRLSQRHKHAAQQQHQQPSLLDQDHSPAD